MPRGTVPVNNIWLIEIVPVNNFSLDKQTNCKLALEDSSWHCIHPSLSANEQTTKCTKIQVFLQIFHLVKSNHLSEEDIKCLNE